MFILLVFILGPSTLLQAKRAGGGWTVLETGSQAPPEWMPARWLIVGVGRLETRARKVLPFKVAALSDLQA